MSLKEKENHISESLSENLVTDYLKNTIPNHIPINSAKFDINKNNKIFK